MLFLSVSTLSLQAGAPPVHRASRHAVVRAAAADYLKEIEQGPPDAILGIAANFRASTAENKVNVAVGAYRTNEGVPWVLPSVREAEQRILAAGKNKEYAPIEGLGDFVGHAMEFAYGKDCAALKEGRIAAVQTLSGTGACRIAGEFYSRFLPRGTATEVYLPDPTWGNHVPIMGNAGLQVKRYRYLNRKTNGLDIDGLLADVEAAPDGSVFLLHACAHNPTGVDPSDEQWATLSGALRRHVVMFDCAYQGFASGDADRDAASIRRFVADGHELLLAQSFAKNFGLYGERVGTLSVACKDADEAARVLSQLKLIIRPMYSSPPIHGALIVSEVLGDEALSKQYYQECADMATRIGGMRKQLRSEVEAAGSTHDWKHVTDQIGMFAFTGMDSDMCDVLTDTHNIFLTRDGRISIAGLNADNIKVVAKAIHDVTDGKAIGA